MTAATQERSRSDTAAQAVVRLFAKPNVRNFLTPLLRGEPYDAVVAEIRILAARKPDILKCTAESVVMSVADGLRWKLVFGETVHMVPFNEKVMKQREDGVQFEAKEWRAHAIVGWKGVVEMVKRTGAARGLSAQCVYESELERFSYRQGTDPDVQHFPEWNEKKRGKLVLAYCVAKITEVQREVVVVSATEIDAIRFKYSKLHDSGPLEPWYARKTVIIQMGNRLPKNAKLEEVMYVAGHEERLRAAEHAEIVVRDDLPSLETPALNAGEGPMPLVDTNALHSEPVYSRFAAAERHAARFDEGDEDPRGPDGFIPPY